MEKSIDIRIQERTKDLLEKMVAALIRAKPSKEKVPFFMLDFLQHHAKYTSTGLTQEEKIELEKLRKEIKRYREMDEHNKTNGEKILGDDFRTSDISSSDEEADDVDPNLDNPDLLSKRMSTVARTSVSAEAYGIYLKKENIKPRFIKKKDEQISRIKCSILHSFLFNALEKKDLDIVIGAMEEKRYKNGDVIIRQGEDGNILYLVEEGNLECYVKNKKTGEEKMVKTYGPGDTFGELALLYNTPRAATIKACSDVITWILDRQTFSLIVKDAAQKKREKFEGFLKKTEILKDLDPYELSQVADALKTATFKKGDRIIQEGDIGDVFYLLEEGSCLATKSIEPGKPAQVIKEYKTLEYFGERALIKGEPRACNIIADSDVVKVICLDKNTFRRLLGPIENILKRNIENYKKFIPSVI